MLLDGIEVDRAENNERDVGAKIIALAQSYLAQGKDAQALDALRGIADNNRREGQLIPAAEIYAVLGDFEAADAIAEQFAEQLRPQARAYARLIKGIIALENQQYVQAVDELKAALDFADLWIVRYYLGRAYLAAGYPAEASSELDAAHQRRSEAMAMFFDDVPTWRYMSQLEKWREQARLSLSDMASG